LVSESVEHRTRSRKPAAAPRWLRMLRYTPQSPAAEVEAKRLAAIKAALLPLPDVAQVTDQKQLLAVLAQREQQLHRELAALHVARQAELAREDLRRENAYETVFELTRHMDALLRFAFEVSLEELPALVRVHLLEGEKEQAFKQRVLPQKQEKLASFRQTVKAALAAEDGDPQERAYFERIETTLAGEIADLEAGLAMLATELPVLAAFESNAALLRQHVVMFARGGYGRAEMTFASDLDNGYCLDTSALRPGEAAIYREWIMRTESLLNRAGIPTQHQYFELDEELSRFMEPETLHTVTSILEARDLAGNRDLLDRLKANFLAALPQDLFLRTKLTEYEEQRPASLLRMNLKTDRVGMRTVQIPLWIFGVLHDAPSFMTHDLIRNACTAGMLSSNEATVLVRGLECIYELRNFVGAAERYYYDQEARASNLGIGSFTKDELSDGVGRLYVLRKSRFANIDELDRYRLQVLELVGQVAQRFLERVLDRIVMHRLDGIRLDVHLGRRAIIGIRQAGSNRGRRMETLLGDWQRILELFVYMAESGFALAPELTDALGAMVMRIDPLDFEEAQPPADAFTAMLLARRAAAALEGMLAVVNPAEPAMPSLLGRFIPEFDQARHTLRPINQETTAVHAHLLRCMARGQRELEQLRQSYPEFYQLLEPVHVLACKWSLLLHRIGMEQREGEDASSHAEAAVTVLQRLGYTDEHLFSLVRRLVEHHRTIISLSRNANYADQAMTEYFEASDRDVVHMVLLYVVNAAVLDAARDNTELESIRRFFGEAAQILSSVRGVLKKDEAIDLINTYFDEKRADLKDDTRTELLYRKVLVQGLEAAVLHPIEREHPDLWARLEPKRRELEGQYRAVVLGSNQSSQRQRNVLRLIQSLRDWLPVSLINALTRDRAAEFDWFFASVPNRYLLAMPPRELAKDVIKFAQFRATPVTVDVVGAGASGVEGLLINTLALERSHMRVAYALNRMRINIRSGKINHYQLADGRRGYVYYFQISRLDPAVTLNPRDLELIICEEVPPEFTRNRLGSVYRASGTRVDFSGDDGKGYVVLEQEGTFSRKAADFAVVRVVFRDQPFLFFKVCRTFEMFDVEVQQALITTTGNQVLDRFYLRPADAARLFSSNFEETLIQMMNTSLLEPTA